MTNSRTLTETASELAAESKESFEERGRSAGQRLDQAGKDAGNALHTAASSIRKTGRQGSKAINKLATETADKLDTTASFVKTHELKDAWNGVERLAHRNLRGALMTAAAFGFFAGVVFKRVTHRCARTPEGS